MVKIRIKSLNDFSLKGVADDMEEEDTQLLIWVICHSLYRDQLEDLAGGIEKQLDEIDACPEVDDDL